MFMMPLKTYAKALCIRVGTYSPRYWRIFSNNHGSKQRLGTFEYFNVVKFYADAFCPGDQIAQTPELKRCVFCLEHGNHY
jgi:hypothetical protein